MELSTTIIGMLMLIFFILPVVIIARAGQGKKKRYEKDFFSYVSKNGLKISEKDFWDDYAIGIDISKNLIIYLNWSSPEKTVTVINLKEVKVFETFPDYREMNKKNFNYEKVGRLSLRFIFKESVQREVNITFFIAEFGHISESQIKMFRKWTEIIRNYVTTNQVDDFRFTA